MKKFITILILAIASLSLLLALGGCKPTPTSELIENVDGYYVYKELSNPIVKGKYALFGADSDKIINGVLTVPEQINGIPVATLGYKEYAWVGEGAVTPMFENDEIKKIVINHDLMIYQGALTKLHQLAALECNEHVVFWPDAIYKNTPHSVSLVMDDPLRDIMDTSKLHCVRVTTRDYVGRGQPFLKIDYPENIVALFIADYTRLPVGSFANYNSLSSLIIPETITEIETDAFKNYNVDVFVRLDEETFKQALDNGWDEGVNVEWGFKDEIIIFDSMGGTQVQTESTQKNYVKAKVGETITPPQQPAKEGYTFLGWFKDYTLVEQWSFATDLVQESTVLVAGWQKI